MTTNEPTEPGWYWLDDDGEGLTPCRVEGALRTGLVAYPGGSKYGYAIPADRPMTWGGRCVPPRTADQMTVDALSSQVLELKTQLRAWRFEADRLHGLVAYLRAAAGMADEQG